MNVLASRDTAAAAAVVPQLVPRAATVWRFDFCRQLTRLLQAGLRRGRTTPRQLLTPSQVAAAAEALVVVLDDER